METQHSLHGDMRAFERLLKASVAPALPAFAAGGMRMLDLACGQCDEAETLVAFAREQAGGEVELVGVDIRIREILQAKESCRRLPAKFLLEDASRLDRSRALKDPFDMVLLRHQNFWHGRALWTHIFEQGLNRLNPGGLLVISSYFDKEHLLAVDALQKLGGELLTSAANPASRALPTAGKSVDRHLAVFRRPP